MSSATSIDRVAADRAQQSPSRKERDQFRPWHFFVLSSLLAATAAVVVVRDLPPAYGWVERLALYAILSLTIGAAGFAAGALYRTLAPLVGERSVTTERRLTESSRALLEREKNLTLRSIKELEFDRAMGKVSEKDFEDMVGRLRARAMSLMRQLDITGSGYRELIERELQARLRRAPAGDSAAPAPPRPAGLCGCGTQNDADAMFCKRCGTKLEGIGS